jgi:hypothetical protein
MKQEKPTRREISSFWARVERYETENLEAARIIASDPDRYGGEGSGLLIWAKLTLERSEKRRAA